MNTPSNLNDHGTQLWTSITAEFELNGPELEILEQACRVSDHCASLAEIVAEEGEIILSERYREPRVHPALVELRHERSMLGRLLVTLRIPVGGDESDKEQARGRMRGWHQSAA
jgi:hypothetical protein